MKASIFILLLFAMPTVFAEPVLNRELIKALVNVPDLLFSLQSFDTTRLTEYTVEKENGKWFFKLRFDPPGNLFMSSAEVTIVKHNGANQPFYRYYFIERDSYRDRPNRYMQHLVSALANHPNIVERLYYEGADSVSLQKTMLFVQKNEFQVSFKNRQFETNALYVLLISFFRRHTYGELCWDYRLRLRRRVQ